MQKNESRVTGALLGIGGIGTGKGMPSDIGNECDKAQKLIPPKISWVLVGIIVICCVIEFTLMAADVGLIGSRVWRSMAYQNGAFWAGLLDNWRPNFPWQRATMFITYAFLHGDFWHLAGNMVSLVFLGRIAMGHVGSGFFILLYVVSALGGALAFGILTQSHSPMVGASGALFGLVGAWQYWEWKDLGRKGQSRFPIWRTVFGLVCLNVLMWALLGGALAWETHFGGFIFGGLIAAFHQHWGAQKEN